MQRFHQFLFIASLVALSWFAMMGVHELGHVVGAIVTGGNVERVGTFFARDGYQDVGPCAGHGGARDEVAADAAQASIESACSHCGNWGQGGTGGRF